MGADVQITTILILTATILLSIIAGIFTGFRFFDVISGTIMGCIGFIFEILFAKDNAIIFFIILSSIFLLGYFIRPLLHKVFKIEKAVRPTNIDKDEEAKVYGFRSARNVDGMLEPYVSHCDKVVMLKNVPKALEERIGFPIQKSSEDEIEIPYSNEDELASIFDKLRILGLSFSAGKEWSPAEIFAYLREKGKLSGKFKKIFWLGPNLAKTIDC